MRDTKKQINVRVSEKEKAQLESFASYCGLSLSEYLRQRGLGYEPKPMLSEMFYLFYRELCELCNQQMTPQTEEAVLALVDDVRKELILPKKQTKKEVAMWQPPDSGP